VCMGLGLTPDLYLKLCLAGCFGEVFGRKSQGLLHAKVLYNFCSSSLMVLHRQGRCCASASGSCGGYHYSALLGLRLAWSLSIVVQVCGSAESQTC
jgi:hypothetical protein